MSKLKVTNLRNIGLSCGVMILSTAGILHTFLGGGWSKKTGEAAKLYPRIIYGILIVVALSLLVMELAGRVPPEPPAIAVVKWWQPLLILAVGVAFFLFVLYVGTAAGILLYLCGTIALFDEDPKKHWKMDLLVAVIATAAMWLIFTRILPIVTLKQLLI